MFSFSSESPSCRGLVHVRGLLCGGWSQQATAVAPVSLARHLRPVTGIGKGTLAKLPQARAVCGGAWPGLQKHEGPQGTTRQRSLTGPGEPAPGDLPAKHSCVRGPGQTTAQPTA